MIFSRKAVDFPQTDICCGIVSIKTACRTIFRVCQENKMKEIKITFRPESIVPTDTGFEMRVSLFNYAMATVGKKIPTGAHSELWPGPNPRDTEIKFVNNGDTEKMLAAIADYSLPSTFQASHGGLHYSCSSYEKNPDGTITLTLRAENTDGIFGGGHSHYRFEHALETGVLTAECPHYIRVSFHIGLSNQEVTGCQNSGVKMLPTPGRLVGSPARR
jgi:hypothetical protein